MSHPDEKWMRLALDQAERGIYATYPNPWVGALLVKGGKRVGKGFHPRAGGPHAEAEVLRKAGDVARGATLYTTLEPCNHFGKTPPCTHAILRAGVIRVVAACPDPGKREGGGMAWLASHGVDAEPNWVLRAEAEALIAPWLFSVKRGRPWVLLKAGVSLDGKTATAGGESRWITGDAARHDARLLRGQCDGLLVGAGTVAADDPELFPAAGSPFGPARFILDPGGRLDLSQGIFRQAGKSQLPPVHWLVGPRAAEDRRAKAAAMGVKVQVFEQDTAEAMLVPVLKWMNTIPLRRLMVEGGSRTLGAFLRLGLAEELALYMAPMVMGGQDSLSAFGGPGPLKLKQGHRIKNLKAVKVGEDLKLSGTFV